MISFPEIDSGGAYDPMNDEFIRVVDGRRLVYRPMVVAPVSAPVPMKLAYFPNRFDVGLDEQSVYFSA